MAVTADTFFGGTITFGTSTVLSIDILSGGRSGVSSTDIETSHGGTTGGNKTYIPGDLIEPGSYDFDVLFDPEDDVDVLVAVSQTITITYPVPSGKTTGKKAAFTGWISSFDETLPIDDKMTASLSLKVAGAVTHTAAV